MHYLCSVFLKPKARIGRRKATLPIGILDIENHETDILKSGAMLRNARSLNERKWLNLGWTIPEFEPFFWTSARKKSETEIPVATLEKPIALIGNPKVNIEIPIAYIGKHKVKILYQSNLFRPVPSICWEPLAVARTLSQAAQTTIATTETCAGLFAPSDAFFAVPKQKERLPMPTMAVQKSRKDTIRSHLFR